MGIPPILNIASQLVLPINFLGFKGFCVPILYLFYNLYCKVLVAAPIPTIVLPQAPNFLLNFLLMITVSLFEGGLALTHILTPTSTTGSKVDYETASAIHLLLDLVSSACIGAGKCDPLLDNWAGNPALGTFLTSRVFFNGFWGFLLSH